MWQFKCTYLCNPSIILLNPDKNKDNVQRVRLAIVDNNFRTLKSVQCIQDFNETFLYTFSDFLNKSFLIHQKCTLLRNDTLTILCEIDSIKNLKKFRENKNLSYNLQSKKYSDVTLVVGKKELHVHKVILAQHSSVFSVMFKHDMKEKEQNIVKITDIDDKTVESLLEYIYTGRVENINDSAHKLLFAAEKYDLEQLKVVCIYALIDQITFENVCEMIKLADKYQSNELKIAVSEFISSHDEEMKKIPEYKILSDLPFLSLKDLSQYKIILK